MPDLASLAQRQLPDPDGTVDRWARRFAGEKGKARTLAVMEAMTHAAKAEFRYQARHEEGTQTAAETIARGSGTCRDFAVLMMEALRSFSVATRLVTGYLYDDTSGTTRGGEAHVRFKANRDGLNSDVYPTLAEVAPDLFGLSVVGVNGAAYATGDSDRPFSIMSVSKPFVFALVCEVLGAEAARRRLGVNATGLPFNSLEAIERSDDGRTNPMVNPGAIAATSLAPGSSVDQQWRFIREGLSRFAGRALTINDAVFASAMNGNSRNQAIGQLLHNYGLLAIDPADAVDLYTRQCSLNVTASDLAVMGATLADGGVNPLTGTRVIGAESCKCALAVMATAGLYETSGDWLYDVGLLGKSGIGGGIVAVSPGKGGFGAFAPRLDEAGNSVKGQLAARYLSHCLGLSLFASTAEI
jgi:glutaminase